MQEFKAKNRGWVKNVAIIFLAVLLVLTFFSNTIMNRSLTEVATKEASSGSIVAQIRGTGVVTANGSYKVKADQTREIRIVMVKEGQQVNAGDVLFVWGSGSSMELEEAQETLRQLEMSYQRAAIGVPVYDYSLTERRIKQAEDELIAARALEDEAKARLEAASNIPEAELKAAQAELEAANGALKRIQEEWAAKVNEKQTAVDTALSELNALPEDATEEEKTAANDKLTAAQLELNNTTAERDLAVAAAQTAADKALAKLTGLTEAAGPYAEEYNKAVEARKIAEDSYYSLKYDFEQQKLSDNKSSQLAALELQDLATQIQKHKEKMKELSGNEGSEVLANVSGTVESVECTAGDTVAEGSVLCSIEVPDMGYTMSFSVTKQQASKLRLGDTGTSSNYYWGSEVLATLSSIKTDPQDPQKKKLLTFELSGDVNAGAELTIAVGQKSANYDIVVPSSAIRSDSNGDFVYKIVHKSSPLGNRYIATRVDVEILAKDDLNAAVNAELGYGDFVITTTSAPINDGEQVRLADS